MTRRLPVGAELQADGSTHFRVWAPDPSIVSLAIVTAAGDLRDHRMEAEPDGYYAAQLTAPAGTRYYYRLDADLVPDPASRYQPEGPFGPSEVIDATKFRWTAPSGKGVTLAGQVIYELHIGTFTPEGTWAAAAAHLPHLAEVGISVIEVMPVAEFPGRFGWGYDGVFPYAPTRLYGTPDDFRAFVDAAHAVNLGVILDVVYNHLGPEGCVFGRYAQAYYSKRYKGEWGDPLNFDADGSAAVREYFAHNAAYWIAEFQLDGLRLDATQGILDASPEHVLVEIGRRARAAARGREIMLVAENEPQHTRLVRPAASGGYGLDGLWNDDLHHSLSVALTGRSEAYYSDHRGTPQEFISAAKYGYLFQGQRYAWQKQPRGSSSRGLKPETFVNFLENHDQVANSGDGSRLRSHTSPGRYRAASALVALMPGTPMLFQGQEFGATTPFLYFADLSPDLAVSVQRGRAEFVAQFPSLASPEVQARLAPPQDPRTFERSKLDWDERERNSNFIDLYRDLFTLRRTDPALSGTATVDGAVIGDEIFVLRYLMPDERDDRLLVVNFGRDFSADSIAEPLVAPPEDTSWRVKWCSEHPDYGGLGTPPIVTGLGWKMPGHAAAFLEPHDDRA